MNTTLYDPSDVAFGAQPRLMCAACEKQEVGIYEPVCPECRKSLWSRPESCNPKTSASRSARWMCESTA